MNYPILILGMHRSGTSMVAEILYRWGAYPGQKGELLAADAWNRRGHWEYIPLVKFNEDLLLECSAYWFVPPANIEILKQKVQDLKFAQNALQLILQMNLNHSIWYWKDPRLCITLGFWNHFIKNPISIIVVRNPYDIAMSLKNRNKLPISASLLLWQRYMLDLLVHSEFNDRKIFIQYESLIEKPEKECERLCKFLNEQCGIQADAQKKISSMLKAIDPQLRHHCSNELFKNLATEEQIRLYTFLKIKTDNPLLPFNPADYPLYPGWREYLLTILALIDARQKLREIRGLQKETSDNSEPQQSIKSRI